MKRILSYFILFSVFILFLLVSSCSVNSDLMFRTPKDYEFDEPVTVTYDEYLIAPNDIITFYLYTNDGFMLIDLQSLGGFGPGGRAPVNASIKVKYLIEDDGYVKLPTLRRVKLAGFTIDEAEAYLEKEYSKDYIDPFIILRVMNRRVIVSTGAGGASTVVMLENANVRLIEALALAGGIQDRGKSKLVKLIRTSGDSTQVYSFDLSKIEGIEGANMIVQANDIIYVEPAKRIQHELLVDWMPVFTLITTIIAVYAIVVAIGN